MSQYARIRDLKLLAMPAVFIVLILVSFRYLSSDVAQADAMARGIAGPVSWPRFALYGMLLCAVGWFVQTVLGIWRQRISGIPINGMGGVSFAGSEVMIWSGVILTLLYGFMIPVLGYPVATVTYIVLWLLLGGIRRPVLISLVALPGTVFLLYMFVKVALMPLDRGRGAFGELSVAIYRLLGIY